MARLKILKNCDYLDKEDETVKLKGKICSEIATCDELILTEVIFPVVDLCGEVSDSINGD